VIHLIIEEFTQLKQELVGEEELRRAKDHLKGSMMLGLESTSNRMANLARQALYFGRFISMDEMLNSIEKVTAAEVQQLAQDIFDPRHIALTVLGNLEGLRVGREELAC
jgi:predicted Zn-dependent peptidase